MPISVWEGGRNSVFESAGVFYSRINSKRPQAKQRDDDATLKRSVRDITAKPGERHQRRKRENSVTSENHKISEKAMGGG